MFKNQITLIESDFFFFNKFVQHINSSSLFASKYKPLKTIWSVHLPKTATAKSTQT